MQAEFGANFQRTLVRACLSDPTLLTLVQRHLGDRQLRWSDPGAAWAWGVINETEHPSLLQLETEMARLAATDAARPGATVILAMDDVREQEFVRQQVVEWARRFVFEAAYRESAPLYQEGKVDNAIDVMRARLEQLADIRLEVADRGWFFEDLDSRMVRRQAVALGDAQIPLGVNAIDKAMGGGLAYGQLEVPLAYSGIGKTFYCVQRGFVGARLRRKVLHFVLEGGRAVTEDRYEARFANTVFGKVRAGDIDGATMHNLRSEYSLMRERLVIRGFADRQAWRISYEDILGELAELRRSRGWVPDIIIVDYGDLLHAPGDDERTKQKTAFRQLKALSERSEFRGHHGYAVCAPSQAQRPGQNKDRQPHWVKPRDIADCYEKVRVADFIISLNRTEQEREQNQLRLLLGKNRHDEDSVRCVVETDYAHGALSKLGYADPVPVHPEIMGRADA